MKEYTVEWTIQISAETPEEAAQHALDIQRDPDSLATAFMVVNGAESYFIDLNED